MNRVKQFYFRPECLGRFAPCNECNGDDEHAGEPLGAPCAAREGCIALQTFIGGADLVDDATIAAALERWPSHRLNTFLAGELDVNKRAEAGKISRTTCYRPTTERYSESLSVIDIVVKYFAKQLGREVVNEGVRNKKSKTVYLRWHTDGNALLREVRKGIGKDRTVAKFTPHVESPTCNLKLYTADFESAYSLDPPGGVPCRVWQDTPSQRVALVGIDPHTARDAGLWLARCVRSELIGKI
jgi:hypothetical protein